MKDWLLVASVATSHLLYQFAQEAFPNASQANEWAFYILRSIEPIAFITALLSRHVLGKLGRMAALWAICEEAQVLVCGSIMFNSMMVVAPYSGLCVKLVGPTPYAAIAATSLLVLRSAAWKIGQRYGAAWGRQR